MCVRVCACTAHWLEPVDLTQQFLTGMGREPVPARRKDSLAGTQTAPAANPHRRLSLRVLSHVLKPFLDLKNFVL